MKQKYKITVNDSVLFESSDIQEFNKEAERLRDRRTGRTTRMLLTAMGSNKSSIFIVAHTSLILKHHIVPALIEIFDKLGFEFKFTPEKYTIQQFGKTYRFITRDEYFDPRFWKGKDKTKYEIYMDEL